MTRKLYRFCSARTSVISVVFVGIFDILIFSGNWSRGLFWTTAMHVDVEEKLGRIQFSIGYNSRDMVLTLKVMKAAELAAKDFSGTSDPYVKIMLLPDKKHKLQTNVKRKISIRDGTKRSRLKVLYSAVYSASNNTTEKVDHHDYHLFPVNSTTQKKQTSVSL